MSPDQIKPTDTKTSYIKTYKNYNIDRKDASYYKWFLWKVN